MSLDSEPQNICQQFLQPDRSGHPYSHVTIACEVGCSEMHSGLEIPHMVSDRITCTFLQALLEKQSSHKARPNNLKESRFWAHLLRNWFWAHLPGTLHRFRSSLFSVPFKRILKPYVEWRQLFRCRVRISIVQDGCSLLKSSEAEICSMFVR